MYTAIFLGFMSGLSSSLGYYGYAVIYRYGAYTLTLDSDHLVHSTYKEFNTYVMTLLSWLSQSSFRYAYVHQCSNLLGSKLTVFNTSQHYFLTV